MAESPWRKNLLASQNLELKLGSRRERWSFFSTHFCRSIFVRPAIRSRNSDFDSQSTLNGLSRCSAVTAAPKSSYQCRSRHHRNQVLPSIHLLHGRSTHTHTYTLHSMPLLRQSTQAFRAAASASSSARYISTSAIVRSTAHPNTSPAPVKRTDNQGRDLAAEQLKRYEQAVTADLVSSAPGRYTRRVASSVPP